MKLSIGTLIPSIGWKQLESVYYEQIRVTSVNWEIKRSLKFCSFASAPHGGCIDQKDSGLVRSTIQNLAFISNSGIVYSIIRIAGNSIAALGVDENEQAIIVFSDGNVNTYSFSVKSSEIDLGQEAQKFGIASCCIVDNGFAVLLGNGHFVLNTSLTCASRQRISQTLVDEERAILISQKQRWKLFKNSEGFAIIAIVDSRIILLKTHGQQSFELQDGPFDHFALSFDKTLIALMQVDGTLCVYDSKFKNKISKSKVQFEDCEKLLWCGNDCVIVKKGTNLHLVGPEGSHISLEIEETTFLVEEVDGVRTISEKACEIIRKVPKEIEAVYKIGSTEPSAILLDCAFQLSDKVLQSYENLHMIIANLASAVSDCIVCTMQEFRQEWQKKLIAAACFGMVFLKMYNRDKLVDSCKLVRVMNQVRSKEIGIALTWHQLNRLKPMGLLKMITRRKKHYLALKIAEYLDIPTLWIYVDWAQQVIQDCKDSEEFLFKRIKEKCKNQSGVSYSSLAMTAARFEKLRLAELLLGLEKSAIKQIPMLIEMHRYQQALRTAVDDLDTDLIIYTMLKLKKSLPLPKFFKIILQVPESLEYLQVYAIKNDKKLLKQMYFQQDEHLKLGLVLFEEAQGNFDILKKAQKLFQNGQATYEAKQITNYCKLIELEKLFSKETRIELSRLSVGECIEKLLMNGNSKHAELLKKEFNVAERLWWHIKLRALANNHQWLEFQSWIDKTKLVPISFKMIAQICINKNMYDLANHYLKSCTDMTNTEKAELLSQAQK